MRPVYVGYFFLQYLMFSVLSTTTLPLLLWSLYV